MQTLIKERQSLNAKAKTQLLTFLLILTTLLGACTIQPMDETFPSTENPISIPITSAVLPSATFRPTTPPVFISTPIVTATPITLKRKTPEEIKMIVEEIYQIDTQCRLDMLTEKEKPYETPSLQISNSSILKNQEDIRIWEIANNPSETYRAFIACESDFCQPKIYLEELSSSIVQEIEWSGRIPNRPISKLMWIGDDFVSFMHLVNPNDALVITYQVSKESFFIYWLVGYSCK